MYAHWTPEEITALESVVSFEEAAEIAIRILERMKADEDVVFICGPMTTGGLGSRERNMQRFAYAIERAREEGYTVFSQIPFQEIIERISGYHSMGIYDWNILEVFYRRLFESGYVTKTFFLPGWQDSIGARWEREVVSHLGLSVEEYPELWLETYESNS